MAISFNSIPADVRVPLFYAEIDNSQAGSFSQNQKTLLIGQKLATATATGVAQIVSKTDDAKKLYGVGSMLERMHTLVRQNDAQGEIWCIALDDDDAAIAATGKITLTGSAAQSGTLSFYIAGQLVRSVVLPDNSGAVQGAALVAAINAQGSLPVTANLSVVTDEAVLNIPGINNAALALAPAGVITLTCKWSGATGNDISIVPNFRGIAGNESTPDGVALFITAMAGGTADPSLAAAITALGDDEYDFIIHPYSGSAQLDALKTELNDDTGRWSYSRQIYGHAYTAQRAAFSALIASGLARNDQHSTIAGFEADVPNPIWEYAAAYAARNAVFLKADVSRPTQTGALVGILPAREGQRFILTEHESLLRAGIATSYVGSGYVRIQRAITTYRKNAFDQDDTSYLDSETLHTSSYVIRQLRYFVTQKYPRHKLRNDGENFGAGQAIVTPNVIRGAMLDVYSQLERLGIVENAELFNQHLIVERDTDPNRINVLFPADYVNQLRVFALLNQFRLQYTDAV